MMSLININLLKTNHRQYMLSFLLPAIVYQFISNSNSFSFNNYCTVIPILRAVPSIIRIAASSSAIIEAKKQQVDVIAEQLKNSVSTVIVDYRGLTVAEVTELRSQLREAGVEYKVYKNTMVRRAAEQAGIEGLDEFLTGPTAVATSTEDVVAPAKVIAGFAKEHEALEIKTGVMEGNLISAEEVKTVGSLPSHDGLVSMLLSVLQAPVRNFAYAVKAVGEQKEESAE